jgi:hypothetical protein
MEWKCSRRVAFDQLPFGRLPSANSHYQQGTKIDVY